MNGYGADDGGEGEDGVVGNVTDLLVELREYCGTGVPGEENACLLYTSPSPRDRG